MILIRNQFAIDFLRLVDEAGLLLDDTCDILYGRLDAFVVHEGGGPRKNEHVGLRFYFAAKRRPP